MATVVSEAETSKEGGLGEIHTLGGLWLVVEVIGATASVSEAAGGSARSETGTRETRVPVILKYRFGSMQHIQECAADIAFTIGGRTWKPLAADSDPTKGLLGRKAMSCSFCGCDVGLTKEMPPDRLRA